MPDPGRVWKKFVILSTFTSFSVNSGKDLTDRGAEILRFTSFRSE